MTTATTADRTTLPVRQSSVYIIGHDGSNVVKIGKADDVAERLAFIQRMSPLKLRVLTQFDGGFELETALHRRFKHLRLHGEWFDFGQRDAVAAVTSAVGEIVTQWALEREPDLRLWNEEDEPSGAGQAVCATTRSSRIPPRAPMARPMNPQRVQRIAEAAEKMRQAKAECDAEIVAAHRDGELLREIGRAAGLSPTSVKNIVVRLGRAGDAREGAPDVREGVPVHFSERGVARVPDRPAGRSGRRVEPA
jgi:hypothetical protein